ncbi:MAG: hypothetical protein II817_01390 [Bacteroidales bacterium]|nr:hypothetical protein [Bacteroidales bacterium]
MNILDNSPITKPAIGLLVTLDAEMGQFADNCLYVLPYEKQIDEQKIEEFFENAFNGYNGKYLNSYDYEMLDKMPRLGSHQEIKRAVEEEKANFLLPLYTPDASNKQYLVLYSDEDSLWTNLGLALYTAERVSANSMRQVLQKYAVENTVEFFESIKETVDSGRFWKGYISNLGKNFFSPSFYGLVPGSHSGSLLEIDEVVTYRKKKKMMERMEENVMKYKKNRDPMAEAELAIIFKNLDVDTLIEICSKLPKKQIEMVCETVNPHKLAEQSHLKLKISIVNKDKRKGNDGIYRLVFEKNNKSVPVHFQRKESFVLYLIYLIDKYNNENVDTLDLKQHKNLFVKLFDMNYGGCYGEMSYEKITNCGQKHTQNTMPTPLKLCYSDIRKTISSVCEELQESHLPFTIKTPQDHISVLKTNIFIPEEVLKMAK